MRDQFNLDQPIGAILLVESWREALPEGGRALVVGHSPTTEAAVLGLTGQVVQPIARGAGVRVIEEMGGYRVEPIDQRLISMPKPDDLALKGTRAIARGV